MPSSAIAKGSTSKYCTCTEDGRRLGVKCPRLKRGDGRWATNHGWWRYQQELPKRKDGTRRNPLRRSGFATENEALDELNGVKQLVAIAKGNQSTASDIADVITAELKKTNRLPDEDKVRRKVRCRIDLSASMTVADWLDEFMSRKKAIAERTRSGYATHIRLYLKPYLGHLPLEDIKTGDIQDMFDAIDDFNDQIIAARASGDKQLRAAFKYRRPVGTTSLHRIRATLRTAINMAIKQEHLIEYNPAALIELPPLVQPKALVWTKERIEQWQADYDSAIATAKPYPSRRNVNPIEIYLSAARPSPVMVWTPAQVWTFLHHAQHHRLYPLYRLIALRGLRRGEGAGLRWENTHLDQAIIDVCWQITTLGWQPLAKPPKSSAGNRSIGIDTDTNTALQAHHIAQNNEQEAAGPAWTDTGYTFTDAFGLPLHPQIISDEFYRLSYDAGLPPIRLHDLRHCAACLMHAAGADLKEIQDTLGHSTITLTSDTYTTLFAEASRDTAEKTANLIASQAPRT